MADLTGTENRKGIQKKPKKSPPPARERTAHHRSVPETAVRCHPPRKSPS